MEAMQKHEGETTMQMVSEPVRILSGLVGSVIGGCGLYLLLTLLLDGVDRWKVLPAGLMAMLVGGGLLWIAAKGWRQLVIDPVASERFLELADPARPLPPPAPRFSSASADKPVAASREPDRS
jgi:hypothetical protein